MLLSDKTSFFVNLSHSQAVHFRKYFRTPYDIYNLNMCLNFIKRHKNALIRQNKFLRVSVIRDALPSSSLPKVFSNSL